MFTTDTGQHALGLLQQIPAAKGGTHTGSPFPLIYGPGHAAMFLPNGHTAAQAAAVASAAQQQIQLQTAAHINGVTAAQSQSPSREGTTTRDGSASSNVGTTQGWRWTALANGAGTNSGSSTVGNPGSVTANCGAAQQAAAVQTAAALH